jgi:hypothetical protein
LLAAWGQLLEQLHQTGQVHREGFEDFVGEVARFLAFKDLALPQGAALDLLASQPGQDCSGWYGSALWPGGAAGRSARPWGGINLGEEPTSLLFLNLRGNDFAALVGQDPTGPTASGTLGEGVQAFLKRCPDYPLVRLRMEPGEGFRLPAGGLLVGGCTLEQQEPALVLMIRHGGADS